MKTRSFVTLGLSAIALSGVMVGVGVQMSVAGSVAPGADVKRAAGEAADARKELRKKKLGAARAHAERAVAYDPQNPDHRALLGLIYLRQGRFTSAAQALSDAIALDPANGQVALNLALAQIATGDWGGARGTLDAHATEIAASDRGLAYALAGDPVKAVEVLTPAAREPDADAKTRQNLALSLALAGRWPEAQSMAAIDVPADQLDARIMEWAHFARPQNAYDQVASLLGVRAVQDAGQPAQLALNRGGPAMMAAAQATVDPLDAYMPGNGEDAAATAAPEQDARLAEVDMTELQGDVVVASPELPLPMPQAEPAGVPTAVAAARDAAPEPAATGSVLYDFGTAVAPVMAAAPAPDWLTQPSARILELAAAPRAASRVAAAPVASPRSARALASGNWYVQLGAYESSGVAKDAWGRASRSFAALAGHTPSGMQVTTKAGRFYRLSVGGFARGDANGLCRSIQAKGGKCFVRTGAGDRLASWAQGRQMAAR